MRLFNSNIGMTFGVDKCSRFSIKCGKFAVCDGLSLALGEVNQALPLSVAYKYLGVLQHE